MTDKHVQSEAPQSNMEKDPSDWVTGDEPMTGAQKSYLKTLSEEAKADFDESLTKAEASERIEALQQSTGRGANAGAAPHAGRAATAGHDHGKARPAARPDPESGSGSQSDRAHGEPELFEAEANDATEGR